jgi:dipeptidyl aminopeptidase/acylaminoacyl peptidase
VFLAVIDLDNERGGATVIANFKDTDVRSFEWVNDDRLVFNTIDFEAPLNDQSFGPGLFSIMRDGSHVRELITGRYIPTQTLGTNIVTHTIGPDHYLSRTLGDGSDDVIVAQYRRIGDLNDVASILPKRLNVATGAVRSIAFGAPDNVKEWIFDRAGEPRVAVAVIGGQDEVFWRAAGKSDWKSIARFPSTRVSFEPLAVDADDVLYVSDATHEGRHVLTRFDFATGKPDPNAIINVPGFDVRPSAFVFNDDTGALIGVRYETDVATTYWFDPEMRRMQAVADERFPGRTNVIRCGKCTPGGNLLVFSYSDRDPGVYLLYRAATKSWATLGQAREDIDPKQMANLDFYRTKARDGEDLPIWVTMPKGKTDKPRPGVVLVHGGPWVRGGHWRFDPDAQFLASRGYVVIEPEFRGSTGYGASHFTKGFGQWGLAMEDDLVDSVRWAAGRGMVDPARVCVAGASYGGYATLMALVRDPSTFKCGVAWVAVTDPRFLFEFNWLSDMSSESRDYTLPVMIGDPTRDAEKLRDAAPLEHAKDIRAPLLLAFGGKDRRVPLEHGTKMRSALHDAGADPEYVVYAGEGHGWLKLENRVDFWTRVERFLDKNLQP